MRRAIFVFFCLVLAVSMVAIPADTISARSASSLELSAPSPAQLEEEKDQVDDILEELKLARGYTDDKEIRGQIDDIRSMVKAAWKYEKAGDSELALAMKYRIAKHLEQLINQLPAASPGMTTAAAAIPEENPLYEELVRVRGKIDVLIDMELERVPQGVTPLIPEIHRVTEPEIKRPPEMERLIVYSAKFLCGPAFGGEGVQPGSYSTAINVHNPQDQTVYLFKKAVIAEPEYKARGQISAFRKVRLAPDEAIEIDCLDIVSFFRPRPEPGRPSVTPLRPEEVEVQCPTECECMTEAQASVDNLPLCQNQRMQCGSAVSTTTTATAATTVPMYCYQKPTEEPEPSVIPLRPEEVEVQCPTECECMTEAQASVDNLPLCQNQRMQCGSTVSTTTTATAATTVPMYCYQKPTEEGGPTVIPPGQVDVQCPAGCECVTKPEEGTEYTWCQNQTTPCGTDAAGNQKYCIEKPTEEAQCPTGCECMDPDQAAGYEWCLRNGDEIPCGDGRYCFRKPAGKSGLSRIASAMPEETGLTAPSEQTGTTLSTSAVSIMEIDHPIRFIKGFVVIYSTAPLDVVGVYTASTAFGFSLDVEYLQPSSRGVRPIPIPDEPEEPPPTEAQCPYPCECVTRDEAREYGLTALCQRQEMPCAWDRYQKPTKFCFQKPEEPPPTEAECPYPCECMEPDRAKVAGYERCQGTDIECAWDQYQKPTKFCFQKPEEPPPTEACPDACNCVTQPEAKRLFEQGWNWCYGKQGWVCAYDDTGKEMYCLGPPEEEPPPTEAQCPYPCRCMTEAEAARYKLPWCQGTQIPCAWDQYQQPTKFCFQEPEQPQPPPPPPQTQCPTGCECRDPAEADKAGYEWCLRNGDEIPCGNGQYCFRKPIQRLQTPPLQLK